MRGGGGGPPGFPGIGGGANAFPAPGIPGSAADPANPAAATPGAGGANPLGLGMNPNMLQQLLGLNSALGAGGAPSPGGAGSPLGLGAGYPLGADNPFGAGAFGGAPAAPTDTRPPEERFQTQLQVSSFLNIISQDGSDTFQATQRYGFHECFTEYSCLTCDSRKCACSNRVYPWRRRSVNSVKTFL